MKRYALWLAAIMAVAHLAMRALGLGAHMSVIAGMPVSPSSSVIAVLYLAVYLLAITAAPVLVIATAMDALQRFHTRMRLR